MELRHLRYFIAVASYGSFNRAAESLHLTQPPLSRQVKCLEEELGVILFVRGSNSVRLTEAGELFYHEAREVLARAEDAVGRVRGKIEKVVLRVGYTSSIAAGMISTVLPEFQAAAPGVRIELADLSTREINEMAGEGRLDLLITPGMAVTKGIPGVQFTELIRMEPVLVLPARHRLAKLKRVPLSRLRDLPLIGLGNDRYPEYAANWRAMLKPYGISLRFASMMNDRFPTLFVELEAQNAAAILIDGIARVLPQALVARPFAPKLPGVPVVIGLPALHPKPHAEMFARRLLEEAQR